MKEIKDFTNNHGFRKCHQFIHLLFHSKEASVVAADVAGTIFVVRVNGGKSVDMAMPPDQFEVADEAYMIAI